MCGLRCIVKNCRHYKQNNKTVKPISLHSFPDVTDLSILEVWLKNLGISEFKKTSRVCSLHFEDKYKYLRGPRFAIRRTGIPTLFLERSVDDSTATCSKILNQAEEESDSDSDSNSESNSSTDSDFVSDSTSNEKVPEPVLHDHTYTGPEVLKQKTENALLNAQKKLRRISQQNRRLRKKISNMRQMNDMIRKENKINEDKPNQMESEKKAGSDSQST